MGCMEASQASSCRSGRGLAPHASRGHLFNTAKPVFWERTLSTPHVALPGRLSGAAQERRAVRKLAGGCCPEGWLPGCSP